MKRLLVIEDHAWVLHTICRVLRRKDVRIKSATTVRAGRERILVDDPYDAIVCEHHLSDGTGLELLGWLRWQQHIMAPFLLIARNDNFCRRFTDNFRVLATPSCATGLLESLHWHIQAETEGILASQIPFAGEPD